VVFRSGDRVVDGWALNASRSGVRAILEESVALGAEFEVEIGEAPARPGRVVWLQEEKDGAIVGVHYLDEQGRSGSIPDIQALTPAPRSVRSGSIPDIQTLPQALPRPLPSSLPRSPGPPREPPAAGTSGAVKGTSGSDPEQG
jgi:hypothetical protein